ncbi:MAG: MYG1 family protein [Candidatus Paceibacterota bacterium]|jgi:uncharacterized UPF0160 family protein
MIINNIKINKLVTHNGSFHADDIFACATLCLYLEKRGEKYEIIRTRDSEVIKNADYVFDVGGVYDEEKNRFDHHQKEFNEKRKVLEVDGVSEAEFLYSSFGLVWKKFGVEFAGGEKEAKIVDEMLVVPVDAFDNGFNLVENKYSVTPYLIQHFFLSMRPTYRENDVTFDEMFFQSVEIAKKVLEREMILARDSAIAEAEIIDIYNNTEDKRVLVFDKQYDFDHNVLNNFPEPLYIIFPKSDGTYGVKTVRKNPKSFANRKDLPVSWGGLKNEELVKVTGVSEAVFCHRGLFLVVAKTLDGAKALARKALED